MPNIPRTSQAVGISLPKDLLPLVQARAAQLDKNLSQYFRGLAKQDLAIAIDSVQEILAVRKKAAAEEAEIKRRAASTSNGQNNQKP